jgi:TetR/AcrR family transcriptional repressor of bet genes
MVRVPIKTIRRNELQKAAYEVALKFGCRGATIEKIAQHAGVSKGIVHHYFDSKHQLLEYVTRYAHAVIGKGVTQRLKRAKTPSDRLWAIVEGNFAQEIHTPEYFRLWFETIHEKSLAYVHQILEQRTVSNLKFVLKQMMVPEKVDSAAYAIMNIYDGFWALASTDPSLKRETALAMIAEYIKEVVPSFDIAAANLGDIQGDRGVVLAKPRSPPPETFRS